MNRFRSLLALVLLLLDGGLARAEVRPFTFVQITDTHMSAGSPYRDTNVRKAIAEANALVPRPAFILNTGDLTDFGTKEQFDRYRADIRDARMPVYNVPGNHEVRWSDQGIARYRREMGDPRVSFLHNGVRFIGFDATIPRKGDGFVSPENRRWIISQLKQDPPGTPAILFCHQPPMRGSMTGDAELWQALAPYNVVAFLNGHGHGFHSWTVNGVFCRMTTTMMNGAYSLFEVGPDQMDVYEKKEGGEKKLVANVPLRFRPTLFRLERTGEDGKSSNSAGFEATIQQPQGPIAPIQRVEYLVDAHQRLNSKDWTAIPETSPGHYAFTVSTASLCPGRHTLGVRAVDNVGSVWYAQAPLGVTGLSGTYRTWDAASPLQAPVVVDGGTIYAGDWNGRVTARDTATFEPEWTYEAGGRIVVSPAVDAENVYAGTTEGRIVALDRRTGVLRWTARVDGPVQAHLLAADGSVYFGAGDDAFHALDARTGRTRWTLPLGLHVEAQPALMDGRLFFGSWDQDFYAVDAATGKVVWKHAFGPNTAYSPAAASPAAAHGRVVCMIPTTGADKAGPNVVCFDAATGDVVWGHRLPNNWSEASPVTDGTKVFVGSGGGDVYALSLVDGHELWHVSVPVTEFGREVRNGEVVVSSATGDINGLDTASGNVRWTRKDGDGYTYAWPAVSNGTLYEPSLDGTLTAFTLPNG